MRYYCLFTVLGKALFWCRFYYLFIPPVFHYLFAELVHLLGVLGTQETSCFVVAGLHERDIFDLFLPEFDKPWVIHLRETCCCSTNLCSWRPNTVYKNRSVRRHHPHMEGIAHLSFILQPLIKNEQVVFPLLLHIIHPPVVNKRVMSNCLLGWHQLSYAC